MKNIENIGGVYKCLENDGVSMEFMTWTLKWNHKLRFLLETHTFMDKANLEHQEPQIHRPNS